MAQTRTVNPWTWQDQLSFPFAQAVEVRAGQRVLYCAGQTSVDAEGRPMHTGDMAAQILQALDNIETVLRQANLKMSDIVRMNYYTTDVDAFMKAGPQLGLRLRAANCNPSGTLLGVRRLFHPDILVEIEATAVE